jgi:CelD/BcsL family acetyltransferase involved in cellulose biosynthesis
MRVRLISTTEELAALEAEWNMLAADAPFRSWDWLATWWRYYGKVATNNQTAAGRRLNVLAVYREAGSREQGAGSRGQGAGSKELRLAGIAPWYLERSLVFGNVLGWLGDGEVCTDHSSLICRPEDRPAVAAAVADALTGTYDDWDRIDLAAVDADDTAVEHMLARLQERKCGVSRQAAESCWSVDLPSTWDEYLAANSKSHRKQLRQLERRVLETERVRWHRVASPGELETAWPILVDLHQRRRKSLGEPGCFASAAFHDFHRELAGRMLARGQLRLSWLELDGVPAAAEYHLADGVTTYAYQGGVDPHRLDEEPGRLSTILCLRSAIEQGQCRFDFLRGDEPYKAHWRAEPRAAFDYRVTPNRRLARIRGDVLTAADRVTEWVRQGARSFVG